MIFGNTAASFFIQDDQNCFKKSTSFFVEEADVADAAAERGGLCKDEPAFGFRNRAAKRFGGRDPFLDDAIHVFERGLFGRAVGGTTGQFRHFGDKRVVVLKGVSSS